MMISCPGGIEPAPSKILFAALLALGGALASPASAGDAATADALFQAGKALAAQKKYAEACPKLAASYKIEATLGTLLNLADCHEKQGLLAQAWSEWGDAREKAAREDDAARADLASRRRAALEPRVPKLTLTIQGSLAGAALFRDDFEIEASMLGVDLPVEPGTHRVTVRRGAQVLKSVEVVTPEGARERVVIDMSDLPVPPPPKPKDAPPSSGSDAIRIRGGFSVNGGVAFYLGADTLPEVSFAGRIGAQITPLFSIYYQNTAAFQVRTDGTGFVFFDYNSFLGNLTLAHRFEVGFGPSADIFVPFTDDDTTSAAFGLHGRLALNIGGLVGAGPRRRAFAVGIDIHPSFLQDYAMLALSAGIGGEWY